MNEKSQRLIAFAERSRDEAVFRARVALAAGDFEQAGICCASAKSYADCISAMAGLPDSCLVDLGGDA